MPQRLRQQPLPRPRRARGRQQIGAGRAATTIPAEVITGPAVDGEPTLFGLPAEIAEPDEGSQRAVERSHVLPSGRELVTVRRADRTGGTALVLAGVAANVSLFLSWSPGGEPDGLSLVEDGARVLVGGVPPAVPLSVWQPLVVVASGGVLVLLGLLLLVPARAHRLVGMLALLASLAAAAALVVLVAGLGWQPERFGPGMWCAVAVPLLGLLGSLKAMLTPPLVTLRSD
ncbi:MAG: hypothetical protein ACLGI3_12645 [Actinomycetes bacterium]